MHGPVKNRFTNIYWRETAKHENVRYSTTVFTKFSPKDGCIKCWSFWQSLTSKSQPTLLKRENVLKLPFFFFFSHTVSIHSIPWKGTAINHIQNGVATPVMCQCHCLFVWLYTTTLPAEQSQPGAFPTKHRKYLQSAFCQLKSSLRDVIHSVKSIRRQLIPNGNITYLFKIFILVSLAGTKLRKFKFIYGQKKKNLVL